MIDSSNNLNMSQTALRPGKPHLQSPSQGPAPPKSVKIPNSAFSRILKPQDELISQLTNEMTSLTLKKLAPESTKLTMLLRPVEEAQNAKENK